MGWFDWLLAAGAAAAIPFTGGASSALIGPALGLGATAASRQFGGGGRGQQGGQGGFFTGSQVLPNQLPFMTPWALDPYSNWLYSGMEQRPDGQWDLRPLSQYPGQLNPDLNATMLPSVWNSWQPNNAATDWFSQFFKNGGYQMPQDAKTAGHNIFQYGGTGGRPTKLMEEMSDSGGTGGKAHKAMNDIMQFGNASPAIAQMMSNLAQFGVSGPGMLPMHSRATGGPSAAANYLMAFTNPGGGNAPRRS